MIYDLRFKIYDSGILSIAFLGLKIAADARSARKIV